MDHTVSKAEISEPYVHFNTCVEKCRNYRNLWETNCITPSLSPLTQTVLTCKKRIFTLQFHLRSDVQDIRHAELTLVATLRADDNGSKLVEKSWSNLCRSLFLITTTILLYVFYYARCTTSSCCVFTTMLCYTQHLVLVMCHQNGSKFFQHKVAWCADERKGDGPRLSSLSSMSCPRFAVNKTLADAGVDFLNIVCYCQPLSYGNNRFLVLFQKALLILISQCTAVNAIIISFLRQSTNIFGR